MERVRIVGSESSREVVFLITSLGPEQAGAAELLQLVRRHWEIENRLHWVRDVSCGEDACRTRTGEAPEILSALRNTVLALIRATGVPSIVEAFRSYAARAQEAVERIRAPLFG